MATYYEQMQRLFRQYEEEVGVSGPTTLKDVGVWAIGKRLWEPQPEAVLRQFTADMGRALREEYYTDPQGRRVRTKHAARLPIGEEGEQSVMVWDDIRAATREHMQMSFQQRRHGVVADCHQLKVDVDSFNENGNPGKPIQISFDFRADVEELEVVLT
jgi:hypothetical protein